MAEGTREEKIEVKRIPLEYNPRWFFDPIKKEEFEIASRELMKGQGLRTGTIPVRRLYHSIYSVNKLKNDIPKEMDPFYDEITRADGIITFIGSSVEVEQKRLDESIRDVVEAVSRVCGDLPEKKFFLFGGGGSRGHMLDAQLVKMLTWIRNFKKQGSKNPENVKTNVTTGGVGPDAYIPEHHEENPDMPIVYPGPYYDWMVLADTKEFNGGNENAWTPTSELLRTLSFLKRRSVNEVTIVCGGGATTEFEALNKLRFNADLIVIKGNGRFADLLFELKESLDKDQSKLRLPVKALLYEMEAIIRTRPKFDKNMDMKKEIEGLFGLVHFVDLKDKKGATNIHELSDLIKKLLKLEV